MKQCDFLRWFLKKQESFTKVYFNDNLKRWFFSIYNNEGESVYLEMFTDKELYNEFEKTIGTKNQKWIRILKIIAITTILILAAVGGCAIISYLKWI